MNDAKKKLLSRGLEDLLQNKSIKVGQQTPIVKNQNISKTTEYTSEEIMEVINEIDQSQNQNIVKDYRQLIKMDRIVPNPYQPRKYFDPEKIEELAKSIASHGLFSPIILKQVGHNFYIIAGERRYRASKLLGKTEIFAIILDLDDNQVAEIALLENIQREQLNIVEEAMAYQSFMNKGNLTQAEVADKFSKSRSHVANTLRVLKLPKYLLDEVAAGTYSVGQIRPLIALDSDAIINKIALRIKQENLTARQVENIVKGYKLSQLPRVHKVEEKSDDQKEVESLFRKKLGTKVKVTKNEIILKYYSIKDLNRILDKLNIITNEEN